MTVIKEGNMCLLEGLQNAGRWKKCYIKNIEGYTNVG